MKNYLPKAISTLITVPAAGQAQPAAGPAVAKERYAVLERLSPYTTLRHTVAASPFTLLWHGLPAPAQRFVAPAEGLAFNIQGHATLKQRRASIAARIAALLKGFAAAAAGHATLATGHCNTVQGHALPDCPALVMRENHIRQGIQQKNAQRARSPDAVVVHSP